LKKIIITSLVVRTTGRIEALREYLQYANKEEASAWKRMFIVSDCHNLPLYIASSSGKRDAQQAYNEKDSMTNWLNDQYKTNLPAAVVKSPSSHGCFLQGVVAELDGLVDYIKTRDGTRRDRGDVVKKLCVIFDSACRGTTEKVSSLMFISHQVIADLEEMVSNDGSRGMSPFGGNYVSHGYGGREGFTAMDHKNLLKRDCTGSGYRNWHEQRSPQYFVELCDILRKEMEEEMDELMLAMLGVEKVGGRIVVTLTGRHMSLVDFEHMMCKVYMGCMRTRGTRNGGAPRPWRDYCWPSRRDDTVGSPVFEDSICGTIITAYGFATAGCGAGAVSIMQDGVTWALPALEHPFTDI
jgi:hypothetical protein